MPHRLSIFGVVAAGLLSSTAAHAATNLLLDPGFESPGTTGNGNHVGIAPVNWSVNTGSDGSFNLILGADGSPAEEGNQYLDLTASGTYIYQSFTLSGLSLVDYGAWFSPRDTFPIGSGGNVAIYDATNTLLIDASARATNAEAAFAWVEAEKTVTLPAGTYFFRVNLDDPANTDATFVTATPVPEPASIGLLSLGGLGVLRRRHSQR